MAIPISVIRDSVYVCAFNFLVRDLCDTMGSRFMRPLQRSVNYLQLPCRFWLIPLPV